MPTADRTHDLYWLRAVVSPASTSTWSMMEWDRAIRLARRHRVLARLAHSLETEAVASAAVPACVRPHLVAASRAAAYQARMLQWTADCLSPILRSLPGPLVLLKGAAYAAQDLAFARGRLSSDLDVLLPRDQVGAARELLCSAGWIAVPLDDYDQHYYEEWSHELPPMQHERYGVELDLHHNLLPPRDGRMPDAAGFLADVGASCWNGWQVLSPVDQILHSAGHLFFDAEPSDRVRDLLDLDGLLRRFCVGPASWDALLSRATRLGLAEPLALALDLTSDWLGTPVPPEVVTHPSLRRSIRARPWLRPVMSRALRPADPDDFDPPSKRLSAIVLAARYHWHRMPARVLVPHLWRKWRKRSAGAPADPG